LDTGLYSEAFPITSGAVSAVIDSPYAALVNKMPLSSFLNSLA
jgi:hypothetical protein